MTLQGVVIRAERPQDAEAIRAVNLAAFPTALEGDIVDALRPRVTTFLSLVAEADGEVIGHILFTPVAVGEAAPSCRAMGLAPMAVTPDRQRRGVGSLLVTAGLDACRDLGAEMVVVLGHADYYPRFGFRPAADFGLRCPIPGAEDFFFALPLVPGGALPHGTVSFHPGFGADAAPPEGNEP